MRPKLAGARVAIIRFLRRFRQHAAAQTQAAEVQRGLFGNTAPHLSPDLLSEVEIE